MECECLKSSKNIEFGNIMGKTICSRFYGKENGVYKLYTMWIKLVNFGTDSIINYCDDDGHQYYEMMNECVLKLVDYGT